VRACPGTIIASSAIADSLIFIVVVLPAAAEPRSNHRLPNYASASLFLGHQETRQVLARNGPAIPS
jgi:hypothetical protein